MFSAASTAIKFAAGAVVGGLAMFAVATTYNVVIDNPSIERAAAKKCSAEKDNMVSKATADAISALLLRERRLRVAEAASAEAARLRADATALALDAANDRARKLEEQAKRDGMPAPTERELQWLSDH